MENQRKPSNESIFEAFFRGLDGSYQRYLIEKMEKKPPDNRPNTNEADSAGLVGDPHI